MTGNTYIRNRSYMTVTRHIARRWGRTKTITEQVQQPLDQVEAVNYGESSALEVRDFLRAKGLHATVLTERKPLEGRNRKPIFGTGRPEMVYFENSIEGFWVLPGEFVVLHSNGEIEIVPSDLFKRQFRMVRQTPGHVVNL